MLAKTDDLAVMGGSPMFEIRLLGRFVVRRAGRDVPAKDFGGRLARVLARLLVSQRGQFLTKDALADALWGERLPADPSGDLEVLVSRARRALGDPTLILTEFGGYAFADDERCSVDIEIVRASVQRGSGRLRVGEMRPALDAFREAVDAWRGEPLPEDAYSDWAQGIRTEMQRLHLQALEGGAEAALALADADQAVQWAEMAVARDPLRERSSALLIRALAVAGDQAGALRAFEALRERLAEELGIEPSKEAREMHRHLLAGALGNDALRLRQLIPTPGSASATAKRVLGATLGGRRRAPARGRALATMAMLAAGSDDYRRGGRLVELALLEAGDDPEARAEALLAGAVVDMNVGSLERSAASSDEALSLFRSLDDEHGVARVLDVRAMQTFLAGHIREAVQQFEAVALALEELGDLMRVATPRSTGGHGRVFMARASEGLTAIGEALELSRVLGDAESEAYCLWHRSEALTALARSDEAVASAKQALAMSERLDHREWTAASLCGLGIAFEACADTQRAEAAFRRSLELADGMPVFTALAASRLGLLLVWLGRIEEARLLVDIAMGQSSRLAMFEARLAQARLATAEGRPDAASIARESLVIAESEGHFLSAERLRDLLRGVL